MSNQSELQRRRELATLTKAELVGYIVRLEADIGAFDE